MDRTRCGIRLSCTAPAHGRIIVTRSKRRFAAFAWLARRPIRISWGYSRPPLRTFSKRQEGCCAKAAERSTHISPDNPHTRSTRPQAAPPRDASGIETAPLGPRHRLCLGLAPQFTDGGYFAGAYPGVGAA